MSDYGAIEKKEDLIDEEKSQENDSQEDAPEESFIVIEVDEENVDRPTLGPIGVKRKRNAQIEYNRKFLTITFTKQYGDNSKHAFVLTKIRSTPSEI